MFAIALFITAVKEKPGNPTMFNKMRFCHLMLYYKKP